MKTVEDNIYEYKVNAELAIENLMSEVFYCGEILDKKDAEKVRQAYKSLIDRIEENDYILFTELERLEDSEDDTTINK